MVPFWDTRGRRQHTSWLADMTWNDRKRPNRANLTGPLAEIRALRASDRTLRAGVFQFGHVRDFLDHLAIYRQRRLFPLFSLHGHGGTWGE